MYWPGFCLLATLTAVCGTAQGNEAWVSKLPSRFHAEFEASEPELWTVLTSGRVAGEVRSASSDEFSAGNVIFVQIYEAECACYTFELHTD